MKKIYFLVLTFLLLGVAGANAQVTIGSTADPHAGAILDLKSTTKGLLLPKVALNNANVFQLSTNAAEIASGVGMTVFNTNANIVGGSGAGTYVWNGTQWEQPLTAPSTPGTTNPDGSTDVQIGTNTYKTYTYGLHTWMVENSKEGTATFARYEGPGGASNGKYYTKAQATQANNACPTGWSLPTETHWKALVAWVNSHGTHPAAQWWNNLLYNAFAGQYLSSAGITGWSAYGVAACWWSQAADSGVNPNYDYYAANNSTNSNPMTWQGTNNGTTNTYSYTVRCVKN